MLEEIDHRHGGGGGSSASLCEVSLCNAAGCGVLTVSTVPSDSMVWLYYARNEGFVR